MSQSGFRFIIYFFLYLLAQVMILKKLVLFDTSFCFLYVAFILLLPIELNNLALMLLAFLLGFTIDIFYDSLGLHSFALVLVAYLRNYWLATITPQGGYEGTSGPTLAANGFQWFLVYSIPLVFVHHAALFFVEAGGFAHFWFTMLKALGSLTFTLVTIVLLQYMTIPRRR